MITPVGSRHVKVKLNWLNNAWKERPGAVYVRGWVGLAGARGKVIKQNPLIMLDNWLNLFNVIWCNRKRGIEKRTQIQRKLIHGFTAINSYFTWASHLNPNAFHQQELCSKVKVNFKDFSLMKPVPKYSIKQEFLITEKMFFNVNSCFSKLLCKMIAIRKFSDLFRLWTFSGPLCSSKITLQPHIWWYLPDVR